VQGSRNEKWLKNMEQILVKHQFENIEFYKVLSLCEDGMEN
jgi:hypothetical protein